MTLICAKVSNRRPAKQVDDTNPSFDVDFNFFCVCTQVENVVYSCEYYRAWKMHTHIRFDTLTPPGNRADFSKGPFTGERH